MTSSILMTLPTFSKSMNFLQKDSPTNAWLDQVLGRDACVLSNRYQQWRTKAVRSSDMPKRLPARLAP